jgi:hypothetical protein
MRDERRMFSSRNEEKKRDRNRIRIKRAFCIPSIYYYVRSTSYLGTCLSFSLYSMTLRIGRDTRKIWGKKKHYIKFEGWLNEGMCVRAHEHKQHKLEFFYWFIVHTFFTYWWKKKKYYSRNNARVPPYDIDFSFSPFFFYLKLILCILNSIAKPLQIM